ncbi:MAG: hypothetical protein SGBAC_003024 [Bacillariaceae sp.]
MTRQAKFANSEAFQRLVARRKACGLEELEISKAEEQPYSDRPFDEEDVPSDGEKENEGAQHHHQNSGSSNKESTIPQNELFDVYVANDTSNSNCNSNDDGLPYNNNDALILDEFSPTSAMDYPEVGNRNLPVFRDFDPSRIGAEQPKKQRTKTKKKVTLKPPLHVEPPSGSNTSQPSSFGWKYPTTTAIHDQLPSVEEIKTMFYNNNNNNNNNKNGGGGVFRCQFPQKERWSRGMWTAVFAVFSLVLLLTFLISTHSTGTVLQSDESDGLLRDYYDPDRLKRVTDYLRDFDATESLSLQISGMPQRKAAIFLAMRDDFSKEWLDQPKMEQRFLERFTLITMYYGMNGPQWEQSLYFLSTTMDHCDWNANFSTKSGDNIRMGVECNPHGLVSTIDLGYNNLTEFGIETLPFELTNFKMLRSLHLHNNFINGIFPSSVTHLTKLKSLQLQYNGLEGKIPETIGTMITLTSLGLGSNKLTGEIPSNLSNLLNLRLLGLDNNHNLRGDLKQVFGDLGSLQYLYLENNLFGGTLTDDLVSNWKRMIEMDLSHNLIIGTISNGVFDMPNLQILDLSHNIIDGSLPHDIFENLILEYLELSNNNLHGEIPFKTALIWNLHHLDLSENAFTGTIPDTIGNMSNLRYLATQGNNFEKHSMVDLHRLVDLKALSMKGNNLIGSVPIWLSQLDNLEVLDLSDNHFSGTIPSPIGAMEDLSVLLLSGNELSGTIPNTMSLMTNLDVVLLDGNQLEGDADAICNSANVQPSKFATDCHASDEESSNFTCTCCTQCCKKDDASCTNFAWFNTYDPSWKYGFVQPTYNGGADRAPALGHLNADPTP